MTVRTIRSAAAVALCLALLVAGCSGPPGTSSTPTASPTASDDALARPTQEPVAPPASSEEALSDATATVNSYEEVAFDMAEYTVDHESLAGYGDWRGWQSWEGVLARGSSDKLVGAPARWDFDYSLSSTATLERGGDSYPHGAVRLVGCMQVNWVIEYADDALQAEWAVGDNLPRSVDVEYEPVRHIWLIVGGSDLTGQPGAPECPLGGA